MRVLMSIISACCIGALVTMTKAATPLGARDGRLAPCPSTPNCVSSQAQGAAHAVAPLRYDESAGLAMQRLARVIAIMPRARVVVAADDYLHVEFTSAVFRFVDDVEFLLDVASRTIHFRSASRVGHYDFGVNRKRVEAIRAAFAAAAQEPAS